MVHSARLRFAALVLVIPVVAGCGTAAGANAKIPAAAPTPISSTSNGSTADRGVVYCTDGGVPLTMDVYRPDSNANGPMPALLYVHGGGWEKGNASLGGVNALIADQLLHHGMVVAAVNYRLAPQYPWPAQIEDVKCAVRYLRANAQRYSIDPREIGAWGGSAGGHLVSMLGTAGPNAGFDTGQYTSESSSVQAVVDMFGPADLTASGWGPDATSVVQQVFGVTPGQDNGVLAKASPVTYIQPNDPPFLIFHGVADAVVPPAQSQELAARLQAAGDSATLVMVQNAGHGFKPTGGPISPSLDQIARTSTEFFAQHL